MGEQTTMSKGLCKDHHSHGLIDDIGKDGGLIVCPRSSPEKSKPENLKAMIDFTKEYGIYN